MSDFSTRVEAFLDEFFRLHPTVATTIGEHAHDAAGPISPRRAVPSGWPSGTAGWPSSRRWTISRADEAIDRDLLRRRARGGAFDEIELREDAWNPLDWVYLLGDGLFTLIAREFAPLADRLASAAGRLEGMPAVLDAARDDARRRTTGGRSARFQTETALKQFGGIDELIEEALAAGDAAGADGRPASRRSCRACPAAADDGAGRPRRVRGPPARRRPARERGRGPARRGAVRRRRCATRCAPRRSRRSGSWPRPSASSRRSGPRWSGSPATCGRPGARAGRCPTTTARSSAASSTPSPRSIPAADDLLDFCREENARIEAFCRERDLIGLADEPLEIRWTPVFLRAFGGAMLISPGPLDKGQKAFFAITPMPDDWTDEQRESYLREDNDRMLRLLTIHEAVPGHYLQGVYANRCPSLVRAIFGSGAVRRGLGRLRDPGDDGRRLRRRRPGAAADPLEVLPARGRPTRSSTPGSTATG